MQRLWTTCSHTRTSIAKRYNTVLANFDSDALQLQVTVLLPGETNSNLNFHCTLARFMTRHQLWRQHSYSIRFAVSGFDRDKQAAGKGPHKIRFITVAPAVPSEAGVVFWLRPCLRMSVSVCMCVLAKGKVKVNVDLYRDSL